MVNFFAIGQNIIICVRINTGYAFDIFLEILGIFAKIMHEAK